MKQLAFLIFLLLWGQVDDGLAVAFVLPSATLADDDDEGAYPTSQGRLQKEDTRPDNGPAFFGLKPTTADFSLAGRGVASEWSPTTPCTSPPLYVLMSLQI